MTSSLSVTLRSKNITEAPVRKSDNLTTIHQIYNHTENEELLRRDPSNRRSFIKKSDYAKLHRSMSSGSKRYSVDNLKTRYENFGTESNDSKPAQEAESEEKKKPAIPEKPKRESLIFNKRESLIEERPEVPEKPLHLRGTKIVVDVEQNSEKKFSPADFGYPNTAKLRSPTATPRTSLGKKKDENSNLLSYNGDIEERQIVLRPSASIESIDLIAQELSVFTMDGKPAKKRANSLRRIFSFGKDKKKKDEVKNQSKHVEYVSHNDNIRNESSNLKRQSSQRQAAPPLPPQDYNNTTSNNIPKQLNGESKDKMFAENHVKRFNQIRQNFTEEKEVYIPVATKKPSISDYIRNDMNHAIVNRYIDTTSSESDESQSLPRLRNIPPTAEETSTNLNLVKPKASIPQNSGRPLPKPSQAEKSSPRTIERNLNSTNSKDYPDKANFQRNPKLNDTYGTVFDSLDYVAARNNQMKPANSPPPAVPTNLKLESSKLKMSPNREIYDVQPKVRSPIPANRISTDKIIATELLKNSRPPTPPKKNVDGEGMIAKKPKTFQQKIMEVSLANQPDKIVTNAQIHTPRRAQSPLGTSSNHANTNNSFRAPTPIELRMSVASKMSPEKEGIRKSVEEYYWNQLKKLKEEEDNKLLEMQMYGGYFEDPARVRRSRSLSPAARKVGGSRSLSLHRENQVFNYPESDYIRLPHQSIPEDTALVSNPPRRQLVYEQNFVRNDPERRSVDSSQISSPQRPIFRRGSLTNDEIYQQNYNKRVSFQNFQAPQQGWPTRSGYTRSPPQRRLERQESTPEDEVFLPNEPIYGQRYLQDDGIYAMRNVQEEPLYGYRPPPNLQHEQMRRQQVEGNYGQRPQNVYGSRMSMDSIPRLQQQDIYVSSNQLRRGPLPEIPHQNQDDYYYYKNQNPQMQLQRNPEYSSRQSVTDGNYGQKQITMRNKYADFYGQIHETPHPQKGVIMGRLQNAPVAQNSPVMVRQSYQHPPTFVRGSRLTASANDLGGRYGNSGFNNYNEFDYDRRPLPPIPRKDLLRLPVSDTESGSDASEIQRIMQNKTKKRGFFGK